MTKLEMILSSIASKDIFEYVFINKELRIINTSAGISKYLEENPDKGDSIFVHFPELYECGENIEDIFSIKEKICQFQMIRKNNFYVNISMDYYNEDLALVLLENITSIAETKQVILQSSNEATLSNQILEKIMHTQDTVVFMVNNRNKIKFANSKFLQYFNLKEENLETQELNLYEYKNDFLQNYHDLYKSVQDDENCMMTINDDMFIVKAEIIESVYMLFTLSKVTKIVEIKNKLKEELDFDSLTGVYRKKYFDSHLRRLLETDKKFILIVVDIDNFKTINDSCGHGAGDAVLKEFSLLMQGKIRKNDLIARWGGEEFILIINIKNEKEAFLRIDALREAVSQHKFKSARHVTASFGATWRKEMDGIDSLLQRADNALYKAKDAGKDKVILEK